LQQNLSTLSKWAETWQMKFNVAKCCTLQLSKHHHKATFPYQMSNKLLKVVEQHSYLGIIIDHCLSWGPQVNHACNKAAGFLQRNFQNCTHALKELSYKQFILPVLEYAAAIWVPYHLNDINKIEMIQHRVARFDHGEGICETA